MKDYIDLTQLPPERIDRMVSELNRNDFHELKRFCEELGILYGYPLEEIVNVFSDNLMLDKRGLHAAIDQFSHKHAIEKFKELIDLFSEKNTALSVTQQISSDLYFSLSATVGSLSDDIISSLQRDISISCNVLAENLTESLSELISSQISVINERLDDLHVDQLSDAVLGVNFNGNHLERNPDGTVDISAITSEMLAGALLGIQTQLVNQKVAISQLSGNYATTRYVNQKFNVTMSTVSPVTKEYVNNRCNAYFDDIFFKVNDLSTYVQQKLSGLP